MPAMDDRTIRLECLKLVIPKDPDPNLDTGFFVTRAKALEEFVTGGGKKTARQPRNADKSQDPAKTAGQTDANGA